MAAVGEAVAAVGQAVVAVGQAVAAVGEAERPAAGLAVRTRRTPRASNLRLPDPRWAARAETSRLPHAPTCRLPDHAHSRPRKGLKRIKGKDMERLSIDLHETERSSDTRGHDGRADEI